MTGPLWGTKETEGSSYVSRRQFRGHAFHSRAGQLVELRLPVVLGDAPLGPDIAFLLELEQRRIERAVIEQQPIAAGLLDPAGNAVAVLRPHRLEGLQDHERERALPDVGLVSHRDRSYCVPIDPALILMAFL